MARGAGEGRLFEEGDYFKYFHQREAINQGTSIIRRNTVLQFSRSPHFHPRNFMGFSLELHEVLQYTNICSRYPNDEQLWHIDISSNINNYLQSVSFETVFNALLTALLPTVKLSKGKRGHP